MITFKIDTTSLYRCPACGYYGFNGQECYDCGYTRIRIWQQK